MCPKSAIVKSADREESVSARSVSLMKVHALRRNEGVNQSLVNMTYSLIHLSFCEWVCARACVRLSMSGRQAGRHRVRVNESAGVLSLDPEPNTLADDVRVQMGGLPLSAGQSSWSCVPLGVGGGGGPLPRQTKDGPNSWGGEEEPLRNAISQLV